jgi:hypothetical protein
MNPLASAWAMFPAPTNPILIICVFLFFFSYSPHRPLVATDAVFGGATSIRQTMPDLCILLLSYCLWLEMTIYGPQFSNPLTHSGNSMWTTSVV